VAAQAEFIWPDALSRRWPSGWQARAMSEVGGLWQLVRGGELLAELIVTGEDSLA